MLSNDHMQLLKMYAEYVKKLYCTGQSYKTTQLSPKYVVRFIV